MGGGEIVEVQGGHIVRSTGRKDRHSKVCTAKGPRDRRVRLAAHTAIQFYDVQDRLGYDRPSKAVDWLIKKAKPAIDELAELPPWRPTATTINTAANTSTTGNNAAQCSEGGQEEEQNQGQQDNIMGSSSSSSKRGIGGESAAAASGSGSGYAFQQQQVNNINNNNNNSNNTPSFLPPSLDSDVIADTIKSFFPMAAAVATSSSTIPFQNYPPDLLSRTSSQTQDLRLSLHSFHDPILLHHHHRTSSTTTHPPQALFPSSGGDGPLGFDSWSEQQQQQQQSQEMGRFQRMIAWNSGDVGSGSGGGAAAGGGGGGDYVFNSLPQAPPPLQQMQGQNPVFSQRGPLQSSNSPQVRAWIDQSCNAIDHHHHYQVSAFHQASLTPGIGYASGGFTGFRVPARIQGEEEHDAANKPSSASRH